MHTARVAVFLFGTLLATALPAALEPVEQAYELLLRSVSLPLHESGQLVVRECAGCRPEILRVTGATRYFVRPTATPVSLRDLRAVAARAGATPGALLYVYYDPGTRNVRRLVLDAGRAVAPAAGPAGGA
jgi:hypothetical protein